MSEFKESIEIPRGTHTEDKCPFCPPNEEPSSKTSHIGEDNDSEILSKNLEASGDRKYNHLYSDSQYGDYSAEAHHLICGNEVLKEEGEMEKFLVVQGRKTSKGAYGKLEPNDVGYDINAHENGVWLPSVPLMFMKTNGQNPDVWWGKKRNSKDKRKRLSEKEKSEISFIVMQETELQFHKGPHGKIGEPHNNYAVMAISRLRQLTVFVEHYSTKCPMDADGAKRTDPPFRPPYAIVPRLHSLSRALKAELEGRPESWNYFISEHALECSRFWKLERLKDRLR